MLYASLVKFYYTILEKKKFGLGPTKKIRAWMNKTNEEFSFIDP